MDEIKDYSVMRIPSRQVKEWLLKRHYAHRLPSISFAFGLARHSEIVGVCTFGVPASPSLCKGICGKNYKDLVLEFNRLCIEEGAPPNSASYLIARGIKQLPSPRILVSYADTGQGHIGYVYQATNWIYTGLTIERTDIATGEGRHSRHYDKKGDYSKRQLRTAKHRYIHFHKCSQVIRDSLRYPISPYPKGDTRRYKADANIVKQGLLFIGAMKQVI